MRRIVLLSAGWLLATAALYLGFLLLDVYWNLVNWRPRLDMESWALLVWILACTASMWRLACVTFDRMNRILSLLACLALLGIAVHALPAEPLTEGLFARESSSPIWYRGTRLLVMALPGVFWTVRILRGRSPAQSPRGAAFCI